jgi:hypothetical protein
MGKLYLQQREDSMIRHCHLVVSQQNLVNPDLLFPKELEFCGRFTMSRVIFQTWDITQPQINKAQKPLSKQVYDTHNRQYTPLSHTQHNLWSLLNWNIVQFRKYLITSDLSGFSQRCTEHKMCVPLSSQRLFETHFAEMFRYSSAHITENQLPLPLTPPSIELHYKQKRSAFQDTRWFKYDRD